MNRFVLDSSVTLSWCFEDQKSAYSETILDKLVAGSEAIVPSLWSYEVLNVLAGAQRRKIVSQSQAYSFWQRLQAFPIRMDGTTGGTWASEILTLAGQHHLTAYDASYLRLALKEGLPLATLDEALRKAARTAGIPIVQKIS